MFASVCCCFCWDLPLQLRRPFSAQILRFSLFSFISGQKCRGRGGNWRPAIISWSLFSVEIARLFTLRDLSRSRDILGKKFKRRRFLFLVVISGKRGKEGKCHFCPEKFVIFLRKFNREKEGRKVGNNIQTLRRSQSWKKSHPPVKI